MSEKKSYSENVDEFVEKYCPCKDYDSCTPCHYHTVLLGCTHPEHPKNKPFITDAYGQPIK